MPPSSSSLSCASSRLRRVPRGPVLASVLSRSPHPVVALRVSPTTEAVLDSVVGVVPGGAALDVSLANMRVRRRVTVPGSLVLAERAARERAHREDFMQHRQGASAAASFLEEVDLSGMPTSEARPVVVPVPAPGPAPRRVMAATGRPASAMPSQHIGFIRAALMVAGVCSAVGPWEQVNILVDSGSQQEPLMSTDCAQRLNLRGSLVSKAAQANGDPLPIFSVGPVDLAVNGHPSRETFYSAPIAPYDVILGESWLSKHRGVLDYAHHRLWSFDEEGSRQPLTLHRPPSQAAPSVGAAARRYLVDNAAPVQAIQVGTYSASLLAGGRVDGDAGASLTQLSQSADVLPPWWHQQRVARCLQPTEQAVRETNDVHSWVMGVRWMGDAADIQRPPQGDREVLRSPVSAGSRVARAERRQLGLRMLKDFAKELPEDQDIVLEDIPGLSASVDSVPDQFALVEAEVRRQLVGSTPAVVDAIVRRLRVFEPDVFETRTMPRLPPSRLLDLEINLKPGLTPPHRRPYKVAPQHVPELQRQLDVLLQAGIIRRSLSQYGAPVLFAPKKDGKLRLCVDYRALNLQTVRDRFPTPTAQDLIARTRGAKMFSKVDLQSGFHQLNIRPADRHKTAFVVPDGQYEWVSAPFGLSSTPSAFQRLMNHVLQEHITAGYCVVYCDDVCIFTASTDPMEHLLKVEAVLASLREHQLLAKGAKTELFRPSIEFLGFIISAEGVAPLRSKVEAIQQVPAPETVRDLRSFLGMTNFFAAHLPAYSERAAVLTDLLRGTLTGRQRVPWSLACEAAFADLKDALTSAPVLRHFDPALRTAVHIDGSTNAVGAVLLQWEVGEKHPRPVAFLSRKLAGAQFRYDARNVEALAAQVALAEWRTLLYGVKFEIFSDHGSLQYLFTQKEPSPRILRMCEFMADFDFEEIQFVRGVDNVVPDYFSRPAKRALLDSSLHVLSHPRSPRVSGLTAEHQKGRRVVLLPVVGDQLGVTESGRGPDDQPVFDLFTARVQGNMTAEEAVLALAGSVMGASSQSLQRQLVCVGTLGGVSMWRLICDADHGFVFAPAWASVGRWVSPTVTPAWALRTTWRRFAFDCLRVLGVYEGPTAGGGLLAASRQALLAMSTVAETSMLTNIRQALEADSFFGPVVTHVHESDHGWWRDFSLDATGLLSYQRPGDAQPRVCVPAKCREMVLRAAHGDSTLVGHPGIDRTSANVGRFFYWPALHKDVAHFVRSCRVCAGSKSSTHLRLGVEAFSTIPSQPFSSWAVDLVGPMPLSSTGNDMFITWVDRTTKTVVARAFASSHSSGQDLADLTFQEIVCRFGLPLSLTHDNDVRFRGEFWQHMWKSVGTKLQFTSSYNPQSDPAERANRQVLESLRAAVSSLVHYDKWDTALAEVCFSLNSQVSSATGMSPFELSHGFPARVPLNVSLSDLTAGAPGVDGDAVAFALRTANRHRAAADYAGAAQVHIGRILAARASPATVRVGDRVWLDGSHVPHQIPYKLANRWFGPYTVLEGMPSGAAVRLDLPESVGKMSDVANVRRLKFYEERDAEFGAQDPPVTPLIDPMGVERYEIDRILGDRVLHGRPEYCVAWKGYDQSHDTWVHRDVLREDVPALLRAYDANPTSFQARKSAPKRATKGRQMPLAAGVVRVRASVRLPVVPPLRSTVRVRQPPARLKP